MSETKIELRQTPKLSPEVQTAIRLLSLNSMELSGELGKLVQGNPALETVPPKKPIEEIAVFYQGRPRSGEASVQDGVTVESPREKYARELRFMIRDKAVYRHAVHLLYSLRANGTLEESLEDFAREEGISHELALRALEAVQALEPAGIGARSAAECLELQLKARPGADEMCYPIVREYLPLLAESRFTLIAGNLGIPRSRVLACRDTILALNPNPVDLDEPAPETIIPEFSVERNSSGETELVFYHDYYPTLRPDEDFRRLTKELTGEEKAFAGKMIRQADAILNAIALRQSTIRKIACLIAEKQRSFLLDGGTLVPVRVSSAAEELGLHPSTVYRAVQGKYFSCSRGVLPLSLMFQREITGFSVAQVREKIRGLCEEAPSLSDSGIVEKLAEAGISISRRTVAKYRSAMGLKSSFRRRKEKHSC